GSDAGGQMGVADTALGLVLVLAAGPAAAEGVALQLFGADLDLNRTLDFRHHVDGGKGSLPACVGVERADAHQAVHAPLALEIAVSEFTDHVERSAANAGLVIAQLVDDLDLEAVTFGPTGIQAEQHLRPIASLRAAGAGLDLEVGIAGILGAAQE